MCSMKLCLISPWLKRGALRHSLVIFAHKAPPLSRCADDDFAIISTDAIEISTHVPLFLQIIRPLVRFEFDLWVFVFAGLALQEPDKLAELHCFVSSSHINIQSDLSVKTFHGVKQKALCVLVPADDLTLAQRVTAAFPQGVIQAIRKASGAAQTWIEIVVV